MKKYYAYRLLLFFLLFTASASAQYIQVNDTYTAQQLVDALVDNSCAQVSNAVLKGSSGNKSHGFFTAPAGYPFGNGIILTSGVAETAEGPNNQTLSEGGDGWGGDTDLETALDITNSFNATVLEFDFIPSTNIISFDYIFASEEYTSSWNTAEECDYSDGFAFLLKEAGSTANYRNLAVIPNTTIPVKVTSVRGPGTFCPVANEEYFGGFNDTEHPTNFNGQTVVLTAKADVVAGTLYHIKLVIADQGDTLYDSAIFLGGDSFNAGINIGDDRSLTAGNPVCGGDTVTFNVTNTGAIGYQWFKNDIPLPGEIAPMYTADTAGTYKVEVVFSATCVSTGEIQLDFAPVINSGPFTLLQCDDNNDGFTNYNLEKVGELAKDGATNLEIKGYFLTRDDAVGNVNAIATSSFTNTSVDQSLFVNLKNQYGCEEVVEIILSTSPGSINDPGIYEICDDSSEDGLAEFDLTPVADEILTGLPAGLQLDFYTSYNDALIFNNPVATPAQFSNTQAGAQTIYARVNNAGDCLGIVDVQLKVYMFPESFINENVYLCRDSTVTLNAPAGYTYEWNTTPVQDTQSITVDQPGTYAVIATNPEGCAATRTFTVVLSGSATGASIDISEFTGSNNSFIVYPEGEGNYEFSLDGINYQAEAVFGNLPAGEYTVYIKDINGCNPVYTDTFFILDYPKFFTPNGDGDNDVWRIPFLNNRPDITVNVYDRYGKIITGFNGSSPGWDGKYNGRPLPSTDYWFEIRLENGRIVKGHFAMIR